MQEENGVDTVIEQKINYWTIFIDRLSDYFAHKNFYL